MTKARAGTGDNIQQDIYNIKNQNDKTKKMAGGSLCHGQRSVCFGRGAFADDAAADIRHRRDA
jgi:hypothetical protein